MAVDIRLRAPRGLDRNLFFLAVLPILIHAASAKPSNASPNVCRETEQSYLGLGSAYQLDSTVTTRKNIGLRQTTVYQFRGDTVVELNRSGRGEGDADRTVQFFIRKGNVLQWQSDENDAWTKIYLDRSSRIDSIVSGRGKDPWNRQGEICRYKDGYEIKATYYGYDVQTYDSSVFIANGKISHNEWNKFGVNMTREKLPFGKESPMVKELDTCVAKGDTCECPTDNPMALDYRFVLKDGRMSFQERDYFNGKECKWDEESGTRTLWYWSPRKSKP